MIIEKKERRFFRVKRVGCSLFLRIETLVGVHKVYTDERTERVIV